MHTMLFQDGNELLNCPTLKPLNYNVVAWLKLIINVFSLSSCNVCCF